MEGITDSWNYCVFIVESVPAAGEDKFGSRPSGWDAFNIASEKLAGITVVQKTDDKLSVLPL